MCRNRCGPSRTPVKSRESYVVFRQGFKAAYRCKLSMARTELIANSLSRRSVERRMRTG